MLSYFIVLANKYFYLEFLMDMEESRSRNIVPGNYQMFCKIIRILNWVNTNKPLSRVSNNWIQWCKVLRESSSLRKLLLNVAILPSNLEMLAIVLVVLLMSCFWLIRPSMSPIQGTAEPHSVETESSSNFPTTTNLKIP